jgi:hypothetical protein
MGKLQRGKRPKVQSASAKSAAGSWPRVCLLLLSVGALFPSGCAGLNQAMGNDPLLGGPPLHAINATAPAPPTPVAALPPPAANSNLSTAALAAGAPRPTDPGRDLRIGSSGGNAGIVGWARDGAAGNNVPSGMAQTPAGNGAILRLPEPVTDPLPRPQLASVSNPGSPRDSSLTPSSPDHGTASTFEQVQAQIKTRGVLWQRLEMVGETGEWKFSCSIPNRQNPRIRRTYEAKAGDSVAAIRAVLEQLDKEQ